MGPTDRPSHSAALPFPGARFLRQPVRPSPQSQSFFRGYGSNLPTSLTYIVLSTRGCSPWRPAADIGTARHESQTTPQDFQGPMGVHRTPQEARCFAAPQSLSRGKPIPGTTERYEEKRTLPRTPASVSWFACVTALGPPVGGPTSVSGFRNINLMPFRSAAQLTFKKTGWAF